MGTTFRLGLECQVGRGTKNILCYFLPLSKLVSRQAYVLVSYLLRRGETNAAIVDIDLVGSKVNFHF